MTHDIELPLWQCHKVVRAAQIVEIDESMRNTATPIVRLRLDGGVCVEVDTAWHERHDAKVGGFYVVYEDGYASFSPRDAFLGGYTRTSNTL